MNSTGCDPGLQNLRPSEASEKIIIKVHPLSDNFLMFCLPPGHKLLLVKRPVQKLHDIRPRIYRDWEEGRWITISGYLVTCHMSIPRSVAHYIGCNPSACRFTSKNIVIGLSHQTKPMSTGAQSQKIELWPLPHSTKELAVLVPVRFPGATPDSSKRLVELLQENHEKHHIYFNDDGFHKWALRQDP